MKTLFGLYQPAAKDYNENLHILREEPDTLSALGAAMMQDLNRDLRIKMSTLEEVNDTLGGTFIRIEDEHGHIKKIVSQEPHAGCAVEFDFDSFEFFPVPYEIHEH